MQAAKDHLLRSPRVEGLPLKNHVRVSFGADRSLLSSYVDVSDTGMRVRAGVPAKTNIGDVLSVEFRLPGEKTGFRSKAKVVRVSNAYEFAIQFLDFEEGDQRSLGMAVAKYMEYVRRMTPFMKTLSEPQIWIANNWQFLVVAFATFAIGGYAIYSLAKPAINGEGSRWTRPWPVEWDMEYYNKLSQDSKDNAPHNKDR